MADEFNDSHEYLGGLNYYVTDSRNHRFNVQVIRVKPLIREQQLRVSCWRPKGDDDLSRVVGLI
jgi:hypothetical protein